MLKILARYSSGLIGLSQSSVNENTTKAVTSIYEEQEHSSTGLFILGKFDKRIKGNQSVGIVLSKNYHVAEEDTLFVCSEDSGNTSMLISSVWKLNRKLQPGKLVKKIEVTSKNGSGDHYYACSWALAVNNHLADELPWKKVHATLTHLSAYNLDKGILCSELLSKFLQTNLMIKL